MKIDSPEFDELMQVWSDEAWTEEMLEAEETWLEDEDYQGRLNLSKSDDVIEVL